jgi:hypothetical protein
MIMIYPQINQNVRMIIAMAEISGCDEKNGVGQ